MGTDEVLSHLAAKVFVDTEVRISIPCQTGPAAIGASRRGPRGKGLSMAYNKLNPLEKELLIRLYRRSPGVRLAEFCAANNVSTAAFKTWLKRYDAEGLSGLYRTKKTPRLLPEGVDETEENLRRGSYGPGWSSNG